jgi:hypothetical protein
MPPRQVFSAIVYVLRTGYQWKALPKEFGSASAVHKHFQKWHRAGFFLALWRSGPLDSSAMPAIRVNDLSCHPAGLLGTEECHNIAYGLRGFLGAPQQRRSPRRCIG